ncbi:MAG TPA: endonuclease III [Phycisphaerae bacterium]|nr:endonuclease III [Phycisphaerae bacterium]
MPRESQADRKKRTARIIAALKKRYPDARCALDHTNPLELLVATILSAQCTDARVNIVTKDLFGKYASAADYAAADPGAFADQIRSTGFFRNKAKSILGSAEIIEREFGGKVPDTMDALLTLPGVARKTANVVLGNAFGKNEGIVVDTHVTRVAGRLKLTRFPNNQGDRIERELMELVPRKEWTLFAHLLIFHGRQVCTARKPDCQHCPVNALCPSAFKV